MQIKEKISAKWYQFGDQLGLNTNSLQCIKQRYAQESFNVCFDLVGYEWISGGKIPVTWGKLIDALKKIGENQLAEEIKVTGPMQVEVG